MGERHEAFDGFASLHLRDRLERRGSRTDAEIAADAAAMAARVAEEEAAAAAAGGAALAAAGDCRRDTAATTLAALAAAQWGVSEADATDLLPAARWDDASAMATLQRLQSGEYAIAGDGEIYGLNRRGDEAWRVMRLSRDGCWWDAEVWHDATYSLQYRDDKGRTEAEIALRQITGA